MLLSKSFRVSAVAWLSLSVMSCGEASPAKAPPAPAPSSAPSVAPLVEAPDGPVPAIRTGLLAPKEIAEPLNVKVNRRSIDSGMETLLLTIDLGDEDSMLLREADALVVSLAPAGQAGALSFAATDIPGAHARATLAIWARRPAAEVGNPIAGYVFLPAEPSGKAGERRSLRADDPATAALKSDPSLFALWERALGFHLGASRRAGPWEVFANARLYELAPLSPKKHPENARGGLASREARLRMFRSEGELARLMETTSGAAAIQEVLQEDRALFLGAGRTKATIPVSAITGPAIPSHPWAEMIHALGVSAPAEPLADAAPAEFYYARAASLPTLFRVLDQVDTWGTPASHVFSGDHEDHGLGARYEAQLGLKRSDVGRALGPTIVSEVAVVGSDPYLREGSDVTLLFRVRDHGLFDAALQVALAEHAQAHGPVATEKASIAGVDVTIARTPDLGVVQHRAKVGDLEVVSNSRGAIERVLTTMQGKHPSLARELDFQYMLARDAKTRADVLAYMGDRFVTAVVGPSQKILAARREIALGELMTPGFAALLYGTMNGKSPASIDDLLRAKLLARSELSHVSGGAIDWKPGAGARSAWGTPAALTPLIDLPPVVAATPLERDGYAHFARSYESDWQSYIDPIALRLAFDPVGSGDETRMTVDLRELPLIDASRYREIADEAGAARFEAGPIAEGGRVAIGVGEESELRKLVTDLRSFSRKHEVKFDWLGDWAMLGVFDRAQIAAATLVLDHHLAQAPDPSEERERGSDDDLVQQIAKLPLYAAIGVKNPVGAALALAAVKAVADETTPGLVDWGESGTYRDVAVVRVGVNRKRAHEEFGEDIAIEFFYALTQGALVLSLSEPALHHLIDERLAGQGPKAPAEKTGGTQFSLELASDKGKGLWTALMWMLESEVVAKDSGIARGNATALLRGAPEAAADPAILRSLAFNYFGAAPTTADGAPFSLRPDGIADPARGTRYAPTWPTLPVKGSPVEALMTVASHARGELSFDDEGHFGKGPPMTSLHARMTMDLKER